MAISISALSDLTKSALDYYIKQNPLGQDIQDKPLLAALRGKQETFPGGKGSISIPVQTAWAADESDFMTAVTAASPSATVTFAHTDNANRAEYDYALMHFGVELSFYELMEHGITVTDSNQTSGKPGQNEISIIGDYLDWKIKDMGESMKRKMNAMLWGDGTGAWANYVPGLTSIITDAPTTQTIGGISCASVTDWRTRQKVGNDKITSSPENQTLINTLLDEMVQLRRYGGNPDLFLAGSGFLAKLRREIKADGSYTTSGFKSRQATDIGMADVAFNNVVFQYDPTLDDMSYQNRAYMIDTSKLKLWTIRGEDMKSLNPPRPAEQLVLLKSVTWAGALCASQLNCHGVYEVA